MVSAILFAKGARSKRSNSSSSSGVSARYGPDCSIGLSAVSPSFTFGDFSTEQVWSVSFLRKILESKFPSHIAGLYLLEINPSEQFLRRMRQRNFRTNAD